jgi:hypothetical protein
MTITETMSNLFGPYHSADPDSMDPRAGYRERVNEGLFNLVVPALRRRCKALTRIKSGDQYQPFAGRGSSWDVVMEQGSALSHPDTPDPQLESGHIDHVRFLYCPFENGPPTEEWWSPKPPSVYTIRSSIDLMIYATDALPTPLQQRWVPAIRDSPVFANIYGGIDLSSIPCSLDLLERIYERQALAGDAHRLVYQIGQHVTMGY